MVKVRGSAGMGKLPSTPGREGGIDEISLDKTVHFHLAMSVDFSVP